MYENSYGSSPQQTKGAQNVASRFSIEPEDCVSFGDHNECLGKKHRECLFQCQLIHNNTHQISNLEIIPKHLIVMCAHR